MLRRYGMSEHGELRGRPAGSGDALGEVLSPPPVQAVCHVLLGRDGRAQGIALQDGTEVRSKLVLSNASPQITFLELTPQVRGARGWQGLGVVASPWLGCPAHHWALLQPLPPQEQLPKDFVQRIRQVDTCSPVTKINGRYWWGHLHPRPYWRDAGTRLSKRLHPASPVPSGRGSAAQLPGCSQCPRRPAPAPPPVLHPSQLRGHPPPAPGLHGGDPRAPLQQVGACSSTPWCHGEGAGQTWRVVLRKEVWGGWVPLCLPSWCAAPPGP